MPQNLIVPTSSPPLLPSPALLLPLVPLLTTGLPRQVNFDYQNSIYISMIDQGCERQSNNNVY